MYLRNYGIVSALVGLCLSGVLSQTSQVCDRKKCPGPLHYYEEIGCTPVFENVTSCCPSSYHCDIWKNVTQDYCLDHGEVYNHRESILRGSCSTCYCYRGNIVCTTVDCRPKVATLGCRYLESNVRCCRTYEVCENSPAVCNVDDRSYKAGETFVPINEPEKTCTCDEGYDGVNDRRFCNWLRQFPCPNEITNFENIQNGCAPIYERESMLYNACSKAHICPEEGKYAIDKKSNVGASTLSTSEAVLSVQQCRIGNVTLNIGDKLRYEGRNVKCICEVPPIPTCYETSN
ncbi:kielin/chordin-like protein [Venturia canescens]|uniref:kielin/chordin-like protein n=1 Tax=Venturia canescens TaxID=32260 RepID=UPI001C9C517B|nr:kielin/chordin-like protein [Venturia canescens]XP_043277609.1 kielin/chordin-like protein [Venturia canescens]